MQWSGNPLFCESYSGSLRFGVEIHSQSSGIHSKVVVWIILLRVDSTILSVDFHSKRSIPNMTPKRVDFHSHDLESNTYHRLEYFPI